MALGLSATGPSGVALGAEASWIEIQSPHFVVRSDAGEKTARRLARQFDLFRAAVCALWPWACVDSAVPLLVYATRNEAGLRELVPSLPERTGGTFLSLGPHHVAVLRTDLPVPRPDEGSPFQVLYHEYVHFVLDQSLEELPPWIHEGVAEYLSSSLVEDDGIEIGRPISSHRRLLRERGLMPVAELFAVSRSSPTYDEGDRASLFYAESWALVHCLMQSDRGQPSRLSRYLERRHAGVAGDAARELGDPASLQQELEGYIRGRLRSRRLPVVLPDTDEPRPSRPLEPREIRAAVEELQWQLCASGLAPGCAPAP